MGCTAAGRRLHEGGAPQAAGMFRTTSCVSVNRKEMHHKGLSAPRALTLEAASQGAAAALNIIITMALLRHVMSFDTATRPWQDFDEGVFVKMTWD